MFLVVWVVFVVQVVQAVYVVLDRFRLFTVLSSGCFRSFSIVSVVSRDLHLFLVDFGGCESSRLFALLRFI